MKNRTVQYINKVRARKIMERPIDADLHTFLSAAFSLSRSRVVKQHVKETLQQLNFLTAA